MIEVHISPLNPATHTLRVVVKFPTAAGDFTDVHIPLWRPGRYEAVEFPSKIFNAACYNGNTQLDVFKISANVWRVETAGVDEFNFAYDYYAFQMDAGNSVFDAEQIYLNLFSCVVYIPALVMEPHVLSLTVPDHYQIACALPLNGNKIYAKSYHQLIDSPLLASSNMSRLQYQASNCLFEICIQGDCPISNERLLSDFAKFTQKQVDIFGGFTSDRYVFIIQSLHYKHYHGVEHQDSTVLVLGPNTMEHADDYYEKLMGVASHELFHAWNVTRIRPREMSPYIYHEEICSDTGFVTEGFTTYYGDLILKTSDTYTEAMYLKEVATLCDRHFQNLGRQRSSLIDSSRNLWIDGYKNLYPSRKVSIYQKGALCALIIDFEIRRVTEQQFTLLDIIKKMLDKYHYEQGGYTRDDVYELIEQFGGKETLALARRLYETTEDLEPLVSHALGYAGFELTQIKPKDLFVYYTGIKTLEGKVVDMHDDVCVQSGLAIGDEIVKVNGGVFDPAQDIVPKQIEVIRNGRPVQVMYDCPNRTYAHAYQVKSSASPSIEQLGFRKLWLEK